MGRWLWWSVRGRRTPRASPPTETADIVPVLTSEFAVAAATPKATPEPAVAVMAPVLAQWPPVLARTPTLVGRPEGEPILPVRPVNVRFVFETNDWTHTADLILFHDFNDLDGAG